MEDKGAPDQQRRIAGECVRDVRRRAVVDAVHQQPEGALQRRECWLAALLPLQQACMHSSLQSCSASQTRVCAIITLTSGLHYRPCWGQQEINGILAGNENSDIVSYCALDCT